MLLEAASEPGGSTEPSPPGTDRMRDVNPMAVGGNHLSSTPSGGAACLALLV